MYSSGRSKPTQLTTSLYDLKSVFHPPTALVSLESLGKSTTSKITVSNTASDNAPVAPSDSRIRSLHRRLLNFLAHKQRIIARRSEGTLDTGDGGNFSMSYPNSRTTVASSIASVTQEPVPIRVDTDDFLYHLRVILATEETEMDNEYFHGRLHSWDHPADVVTTSRSFDYERPISPPHELVSVRYPASQEQGRPLTRERINIMVFDLNSKTTWGGIPDRDAEGRPATVASETDTFYTGQSSIGSKAERSSSFKTPLCVSPSMGVSEAPKPRLISPVSSSLLRLSTPSPRKSTPNSLVSSSSPFSISTLKRNTLLPLNNTSPLKWNSFYNDAAYKPYRSPMFCPTPLPKVRPTSHSPI
ncbi:hypothetical protein BABINDRAFT_159973 [Babjeviella inositovora NRRL Y-12698]|uniref:Uncharacterized protein n=1 Tax=Babjeviella inositovora NRRL Y-12698 TaxID=984486 RepID=A0A1E3QVN5_9ASCO|nr:uncharacterized protein BABINDRAFT_159973 [Babjeviella inositovora NRRL Y-12698]ODQ81726.1 hypothetical protein BABINDRAFT_159973 [Babjeviella inositovora NRRL Y-12698]